MTSILNPDGTRLDYDPDDAALSSIAIACGMQMQPRHDLFNRFNEANGQGMVDFWRELVDFGTLSARLCTALWRAGYDASIVWAYEIDEEFGRQYLARVTELESLGGLDNPKTDLDQHGLDTKSLQRLLGQTAWEALKDDPALKTSPHFAAKVQAIIAEKTGYAEPKPSFDNKQALAEGWDLFDVDGRYQLQRIDDPTSFEPPLPYTKPKFASDAGAVMHVAVRAAAGSRYHWAALQLIGTLVEP